MKVSVFELGYRYALPSLRRRLASILLKEHKLAEKEVAKVMALDISTVSKYLSSQRGAMLDVSKVSWAELKLRELANIIAEGKCEAQEIEKELHRLTLNLMALKALCDIHREVDELVNADQCNLCPELFKGR